MVQKNYLIFCLLLLVCSIQGYCQQKEIHPYEAGFQSLALIDTTRIYKPNTSETDSLHFRPVELDIWYPSLIKGGKELLFKDLFSLFEQRATKYQDGKDFSGITEELAQFYAIESGLEAADGRKLLEIKTSSYENILPPKEKFPLIIYMAGINGMGFENFKILENFARNGYIVVSIWSVGRYPGDMTNNKLDMLEQVNDAEFAIELLRNENKLKINFEEIGVLGCSWGGMSSAVLINRNPLIKAFASLDGTETHYFGASTETDNYLNDIYNSNLLNPEEQSIAYLYLESGNKLDNFVPTREYHYYKKLNSNKKYLRFLTSKHEDFICIPAVLNASQRAADTYETLMKSSLLFFNENLKAREGFADYHDALVKSKIVTAETFETRKINTDIHALVEGKVIDYKTGLPLAYVNVGVLKQETGTVTNQKGQFELKLSKELINDSIRISMIGYKAKSFLVESILNQQTCIIKLEEEISQLGEVVVTARKQKQKILGNRTASKFLSTGFSYDQLGAEMGIKINVGKYPAFVDAFNFNVSYNRLSAKSLFRLNMYEIEKSKPSRSILTENILIPIDAKQTGLVSVNLKEYGIILNDDVIVTLEWVKNEGDNHKGEAIFFSLGVFSGGTFVKKSSQGELKKHSNMGVGFNLNVRY